jgi:hypothetical protein
MARPAAPPIDLTSDDLAVAGSISSAAAASSAVAPSVMWPHWQFGPALHFEKGGTTPAGLAPFDQASRGSFTVANVVVWITTPSSVAAASEDSAGITEDLQQLRKKLSHLKLHSTSTLLQPLQDGVLAMARFGGGLCPNAVAIRLTQPLTGFNFDRVCRLYTLENHEVLTLADWVPSGQAPAQEPCIFLFSSFRACKLRHCAYSHDEGHVRELRRLRDDTIQRALWTGIPLPRARAAALGQVVEERFEPHQPKPSAAEDVVMLVDDGAEERSDAIRARAMVAVQQEIQELRELLWTQGSMPEATLRNCSNGPFEQERLRAWVVCFDRPSRAVTLPQSTAAASSISTKPSILPVHMQQLSQLYTCQCGEARVLSLRRIVNHIRGNHALGMMPSKLLVAGPQTTGAASSSSSHRVRHIVQLSEAYTSKTCRVCGILHPKLGGNKVFKCPSCAARYPRDDGGASNIFLRHMTNLYNNKSASDVVSVDVSTLPPAAPSTHDHMYDADAVSSSALSSVGAVML